MQILGISAFYHDSAAALIRDGRIVAAAQEERFTRRRHDPSFPSRAIDYCLAEAGVSVADLDSVAFYDKPFLKFERLLETYLAFAPRGFRSFAQAVPLWVREKLFQRQNILRELPGLAADRLLFTEHHLSHAASAFFPSPFEEAAVLTMDGVGEWATTSVSYGRGNDLQILREIHFPHSLGLFYSAFTYYTGFRVNSGEYKLMGLAPYGKPTYTKVIRDHLIDVKDDGSFRLNLDYFDYPTGLRMTNRKFDELFGGPPRSPESPLAQRHFDLAASAQAVLDDIVVRLARDLARQTGAANLCLAGGVALNCVSNAKILRDGRFRRLWIQPAAGDAGGALGAALAAYHLYRREPRPVSSKDTMEGAYLGPAYSQPEIERRLREAGARVTTLSTHEMLRAAVDALASQKVVGWFQGRMEFGPRALGARSILADARSPEMQAVLNRKVKLRESFRPFAPAVLAEDVTQWFDFDGASPYMMMVADVAEAHRSQIPAVTHVDRSARLQTVHRETNPRFHALLSGFKERTGCPVLVNTSFNVRGEPIVCTPEEAFACFMATDIDALAVGDCFLRKEDQDPSLQGRFTREFAPD